MAILNDLPPESALCHVRRVLSEGIALCESCGTACSYDIGRTDSEIGGES